MHRLLPDDINDAFVKSGPQKILKWAWKTFEPKIAATSSFQTQSLPLLHLIAKTVPRMPVFFLDTGFHFPETLAFRDRLTREFGLNVVVLKPQMGHYGFRQRYGELYRSNTDFCCYINKVEPLERAMKEMNGWITGIRHDQTRERSSTPVVSQQANGRYKICPMLHWTQKAVLDYIRKHELPVHPLLAHGYRSIGCAPCTRPVEAGEDDRAGRWADKIKTECGLYLSSNHDNTKEENKRGSN